VKILKTLRGKKLLRRFTMEIFICNSCGFIFEGDSSDNKNLFCPNDTCEDPSDYVFIKYK